MKKLLFVMLVLLPVVLPVVLSAQERFKIQDPANNNISDKEIMSLGGPRFLKEYICDIIPSKEGKVYYTDVVKVDNLDAVTLYKNSKLWIGKAFVSSKSVIQSDIVNSLIILKGRIKKNDSFDLGLDTSYTFTLTLQFKDNRYKYEISDIGIDIHTSISHVQEPIEKTPLLLDCYKTDVEKFNTMIKDFIAEFESDLKANNDGW